MSEDSYPVRWARRQAVVTLPEHIDVSNASQVREELLSVINRGTLSLIADLTATLSCDHAGVNAVVHAYQRSLISGTQLRLVVAAQVVQRVLSVNGLDRLIPIYPSLDAAIAAGTRAAVAPVDRGRGDGQATADLGKEPSCAVELTEVRSRGEAERSLEFEATGSAGRVQVKQATASVLEAYLGKSRYRQPGQRVVQGQRMMQAASDIYLGWTTGDRANRYFYWRQLRDLKGSALVEQMRPVGLTFYARICGWTLARAHARSGDPIAIASYLGTSDQFDNAITGFAARYADQNERDYTEFVKAIRSGRLQTVEGV